MKLNRFIIIILALSLLLAFAGCTNKGDDNMKVTESPTKRAVSANSETVKLIGRTYQDENGVLWIVQSAAGIEFVTDSTSLEIVLIGDNSANGSSENPARYALWVNGERVLDEMMTEAERTVKAELPEGENTVKLLKLSESANSIFGIKSITVTDLKPIVPSEERALKIEFIGDSITCGYGVDDEDRNHSFSTSTEDATKAYGYKTAQILGADYSLVSYSGHGIISAYTGDGSINTSGLVPKIYTQVGKMWDSSNDPNVNELEWDFDSFVPDIVVINLGTNDNSYVKGDAEKTRAYTDEYIEFLRLVREKNPKAHIVCALGVMGADLYNAVETAANEYSAQTGDTNISCVKLGQIRSDEGYAADWHPTEATQTRVAREMAEHLISVSEKANTSYNAQVAAGLTEKLD